MTVSSLRICFALIAVISSAFAAPVFADESNPFVRPAQLERDIAFWRRIYTEVSTSGGLIHDDQRLEVVYEVVNFAPGTSQTTRTKRIEDSKKKIAAALRKLASGDESLSDHEQQVRDAWPKDTSRREFAAAAERVRFQLGQTDRFREGLVRSGTWLPAIIKTLENRGLPRQLAALPHVESSFNTYAYSKVGAAGMWQFMPGTGRRFLRIDRVIDERLDPYKATEAAASFLQQNYAILDSWPLALTAYNHGTAGMRRAKEQMGTDNIAIIVRGYNSKTFGFASRNFYVAFLAALEIDTNPEKFFPGIARNPADNSQVMMVKEYLAMPGFAKSVGVDVGDLKKLNPSLLPAVWSGSKRVPSGFALRLPPHVDLASVPTRIPVGARFAAQTADQTHRVDRGDTLSGIAARYRVSTQQLADINDLRKPYRLRAGQLLQLPGAAATATVPTPAEKSVALASTQYVVQNGDTLSAIARKFGFAEEELAKLNELRSADFIYPGQVLAVTRVGAAARPEEAPVEPPAATVAAVKAADERAAATEKAEPVTEGEAENLGPTLAPGVQAADSADPTDYSVRANQTIRVEAAETLGHYADWLSITASRLRNINNLSRSASLSLGRTVKLDFSQVGAEQFTAKRVAYHRELQEAFFAQYRIAGSDTHVVKAGESIWVLAQRKYNVPIWLLRQYNPDVDLAAVRPGVKLTIPRVEITAGDAS